MHDEGTATATTAASFITITCKTTANRSVEEEELQELVIRLVQPLLQRTAQPKMRHFPTIRGLLVEIRRISRGFSSGK